MFDIVTRTHRPPLAMAAGGDVDAFHLRDIPRHRGRHPAQRSPLPDRYCRGDARPPRTIVEIVIRLVVLGVALCLVYFGYINYLRGFGSFRMPSNTPIASLYAAIPLCGALVALFTIEQIVNGVRHGFEHPEAPEEDG